MLITTSFTSSSTILQLLIDLAIEDEFGESKNIGNKTNLSNLSTSKKSTKVGYLTFEGAEKGGGNIAKGVEASKSSNYLILDVKKTFNLLWQVFTQAFILQHFDPEWHIRIKTDVSGYTIGKVLS